MNNPTPTTDAAFSQAIAWQNLGKIAAAIQLMQRSVETLPNPTAAQLCLLGSLYAQDKQFHKARKYLAAAVKKQKDFGEAWYLAGNVELVLGEAKNALDYLTKARGFGVAVGDKFSIALLNTYERLGKHEKVFGITSEYLKDGKTNLSILILHALNAPDTLQTDQAMDRLEDFIKEQDLSREDMMHACFTLGHLYDKKAEYDRAFSYYSRANTLKGAQFNRWSDTDSTNALLDRFTSTLLDRTQHATKKSRQIVPVFIVGFPRSGTSLLEKILDTHTQIHGAGELPDISDIATEISTAHCQHEPYPLCLTALSRDDMNRYARTYLAKLEKLANNNAKYVINKTPANYVYLGLIEVLFPNAIIVHCRRNPVDTCLSCYFHDFSFSQDHTYDLDDLASTYGNYLRIMRHWRKFLKVKIIDIEYEAVIESTEATTRHLLGLLRLKWEDRCLRFYKNKALVKTASYRQANKKLYTSSINRWENYAGHIRGTSLMNLLESET